MTAFGNGGSIISRRKPWIKPVRNLWERFVERGSAGGGTTNDDPSLQYVDPNAMDWTLFDNADWLWEFDNIPMPGTDFPG